MELSAASIQLARYGIKPVGPVNTDQPKGRHKYSGSKARRSEYIKWDIIIVGIEIIPGFSKT